MSSGGFNPAAYLVLSSVRPVNGSSSAINNLGFRPGDSARIHAGAASEVASRPVTNSRRFIFIIPPETSAEARNRDERQTNCAAMRRPLCEAAVDAQHTLVSCIFDPNLDVVKIAGLTRNISPISANNSQAMRGHLRAWA